MINDKHNRLRIGVAYKLLQCRKDRTGSTSVKLERMRLEPDRRIVETLRVWPDADLDYDDFSAVSAMLQRCVYVIEDMSVMQDDGDRRCLYCLVQS